MSMANKVEFSLVSNANTREGSKKMAEQGHPFMIESDENWNIGDGAWNMNIHQLAS